MSGRAHDHALVLLGFWFFRSPQAERKRKIVEEALQEHLFYESQRYAQIRGNGLTRRPIEVRLRLPDYKNNPYLSICSPAHSEKTTRATKSRITPNVNIVS
jgi:hypothetical protein